MSNAIPIDFIYPIIILSIGIPTLQLNRNNIEINMLLLNFVY